MFSEATLANIRERMNIVDLVGEYVQLKKSGQTYSGLCPFHSEKSPSFYVHPNKQVYKCFGCQKGGNVFTFLMHIDGLNFPEAVTKLAERTGVQLEQFNRGDRAPTLTEVSGRELAALDWAGRYFHYLLTEVKDYAFAMEYLEKRGITRQTIDRFQIGVSPRGWSTLLNLMLKRKFTFREIVQAGLVVEREGSESGGYDRFRERLMFPIRNRDGQVLGFGARALKEGDQPKYLNSPETALFSKRRILYGLCESQRGIRQLGEVILVEGYMDVIGLDQAGVSNSVATMGTALTEEHCSELRPLTKRAVTVFDPDRAGQDAWQRSVHLFLAQGFFAKDLSLPDGLDPDEYVQKHSAENFYALCAAAPRQVTKLLKEIAQKGHLSETDVAAALTSLTPLLIASRRLPDRAMLWDQISLVLGLSLPALQEIAETAMRRANPQDGKKNEAAPAKRAPAPPPEKPLNKLELQFFVGCVESPELFLKTPREKWLSALSDPAIRAWLEDLSTAVNILEFRDKLEIRVHQGVPAELASAAAAGVFDDVPVKRSNEEFEALLEALSRRRKQKESRSLTTQVKLTARMGDSDEQLRLLGQLLEVKKQTVRSD